MESFNTTRLSHLKKHMPFNIKTALLLSFIALSACGGGSSSNPDDGPTDPRNPNKPDQPNNPGSGLTVDIADVYDASLIATPKTPAANLISNPSFEEGRENWSFCSTVSIVNLPDAPSGDNVVQFTNKDDPDDISRGCDGDYDIINSLETSITLDPEATHYTLSFKAQSSGNLGSRAFSWVRMIIDDGSNLGVDYPNGFQIGYLPQRFNAWTHFKFVFTRQELHENLAIDGTPDYDNLQLLFDVRNLLDGKVYIDDIRLVNGYETLYPQTTMPQDLRDNDERILIADLTGDGKVATMTVGGRDVSYLASAGIQFASAALYENDHTLVGSEQFYTPEGNTNPLITPAYGFRTWTYDFASGVVNKYPITYTGTPGQIFSDRSKDEELAISFAAGRVSVSPASNRLAIDVGSANYNNRQSIVGSPASFIELYDLEANRIASVSGDLGTLSANGKLAISNHNPVKLENNVTIADKDGKVLYSYAFNLLDMVWAPDNNQVAMIIEPFLDGYYNGQSSDESAGRYTGIYILNHKEKSFSNPLILENGIDTKGMHWTKDGKYILYSTKIPSEDGQASKDRYEIRWLNPVTSEMGVVTNKISAIISSE